MHLQSYLKIIEEFLASTLKETKTKGYVLGISGGIDSALVAKLILNAVEKDKLLALIMPCFSNKEDEMDAISFCKENNIKYKVINLDNTFLEIKKSLGDVTEASLNNVKVRLRMVCLYSYAQSNNFLVVGTDNADEYYTGYFTKYGDGGVDLLPIVYLTKGEVYEASKILGVSKKILNRVPSAGLFYGQTDEKEMGVSYRELDDYILGKKEILNEESITRIEHLHKISEHKRVAIPRPESYKRD